MKADASHAPVAVRAALQLAGDRRFCYTYAMNAGLVLLGILVLILYPFRDKLGFVAVGAALAALCTFVVYQPWRALEYAAIGIAGVAALLVIVAWVQTKRPVQTRATSPEVTSAPAAPVVKVLAQVERDGRHLDYSPTAYRRKGRHWWRPRKG
jgi:hypothetical protein